ncbi:MAG: penicillin-binding transpeptidase domain-containing protein [Bdellovibrionales bacterium]
MKSRILILFSGFLVLWGILILRAATLQIAPDARLEKLKRRKFETSLQIRTRRGAILDRHGVELAASVPAYSLFADPKMVTNPKELSRRLGRYLRLPVTRLRQRLSDKERRFIWVKRQLTDKQRDEIKSWDQPGLGFIEEPKRVYPNGSLMAQVLGFVGTDGKGLEGLELEYNSHLQGQLKRILLPRDARGRPLLEDGRALTEVPDGADLHLTIDHEVQFTLEQELESVVNHFNADSAIGVVMEARTSEILALANLPSVDLNEGPKGPAFRRRNRVVTDAFEPGSTMKTFVIAGALREGLARPSSRYDCEGGRWKVGGRWISEADAHHAFDWLTVTEILAQSSNIGTAKIAFDLGEERLFRVLSDFGFGTKTGVRLPGESRGIMNPLPWRAHLFSNISFGQGIAVTPIQLAAAYGAIANDGLLKRPVLVKSIRRPEAELPEEFVAEDIRRVLSAREAATMRLMLTAATQESGTGARARIPGYHVAGKTGTAQKVDLKKGGYLPDAYVSSFAGFVPAHDPRYVILIAVDNPKTAYYGSQVAAPVFGRLAQYLVRRAGLPPVLISEQNVIPSRGEAESSQSPRHELRERALVELREVATSGRSDSDKGEAKNQEPVEFPNLLGLTLREALGKIRNQTGPIKVRGHGVVVRTVPSAGASYPRRKRVTLVLENPD